MKRALPIALLVGFGLGFASAETFRWYKSRPRPRAAVLVGRHLRPVASVAASVSSAIATPPPPQDPPWTEADDALPTTVLEQREQLFRALERRLRLKQDQIAQVKEVFAGARWLAQGNPEITRHPMTRAECRRIRASAGLESSWSDRCDAMNMVPIYNPKQGQTEPQARVCIDQFEFPNIACDYPVTWVRAREAALICRAVGKRLCDAHEWEGACAGAVRSPDEEYLWDKPRTESNYATNYTREILWAYGPEKNHALCATGSQKSRECTEIGWSECGSNTYPSGAFPKCTGKFPVYDLHGNAAEHMSLPLKPEEIGSRGGIGHTEMKGSWFIFSTYEAHEDDCRWRAPDWHGTDVMDVNSHSNYHLGFRCCKDIKPLTD